MKKINCDVVVVGAGPGGSMAAKTCARWGLDTVLVERKEYLSEPFCLSCVTSARIVGYLKQRHRHLLRWHTGAFLPVLHSCVIGK